MPIPIVDEHRATDADAIEEPMKLLSLPYSERPPARFHTESFGSCEKKMQEEDAGLLGAVTPRIQPHQASFLSFPQFPRATASELSYEITSIIIKNNAMAMTSRFSLGTTRMLNALAAARTIKRFADSLKAMGEAPSRSWEARWH